MSGFADRKMLGIVLALASYALYSLHYATMKWLDSSYSLWQLIFIRSVVMLAITLAVGRTATIRGFIRSPYKLPTAMRGLFQFMSALCFYVAASQIPLADVTTLYSAAPLIVVLLSTFILGEKIHGLHWLAIGIGLLGTVVAADPGGSANIVPLLLALGAGLFWALTVVFTRKSGARESSDVQLFTTSLVFLVLSAVFMRWESPPGLYDYALMLALGLQIYLAQLLFFEACRFAPASLVGPLEYSSLLWAGLFGYLIFSDIPTLPVILGGLLVIVSGVALAVSLRRSARRISAPPLVAGSTIGS